MNRLELAAWVSLAVSILGGISLVLGLLMVEAHAN